MTGDPFSCDLNIGLHIIGLYIFSVLVCTYISELYCFGNIYNFATALSTPKRLSNPGQCKIGGLSMSLSKSTAFLISNHIKKESEFPIHELKKIRLRYNLWGLGYIDITTSTWISFACLFSKKTGNIPYLLCYVMVRSFDFIFLVIFLSLMPKVLCHVFS